MSERARILPKGLKISKHLYEKYVAEWGHFVYLVVIAAFDEEESIVNIVQETRKCVDRVIVVDDSSRDNTQELARRFGAIVLQHS